MTDSVWKSTVAGAGAGMAEILCMFPTDVAKTRAQLSTKSVSMVSTLRGIVQSQGMGGLYRGVLTPLMGEAPKRAWKFAANNEFKKWVASASPDGKITKIGAAAAGSLAGMSEALINCPFETVKVRMQAAENLARFKSSTECLRALAKEEGILALYKGLSPQMWRNAVWNGLYFGTINAMPGPSEAASGTEKQVHKFLTGVLGSMLGTLANTPFDVVKSRMQQQMGPGPNGKLKYRGTLQSIQVIAQEEGVKALYKGLGPRLVRLGPGGGIMLVSYDFIFGLLQNF